MPEEEVGGFVGVVQFVNPAESAQLNGTGDAVEEDLLVVVADLYLYFLRFLVGIGIGDMHFGLFAGLDVREEAVEGGVEIIGQLV